MPRLVNQPPSYRLHKASGQAVVTINGGDTYLGVHGTGASRRKYDKIIGEWLASGRVIAPQHDPADLTVAELLLAFWEHAKRYYRHGDGAMTNEVTKFKQVIRRIRKVYGETPVVKFGPLALKALREQMIGEDWCRKHINRQVGRIKHMFKWGVENEIVPASIYQALAAVEGLKRGRSEAKESAPVRPVPDQHIEAVRPFVSRQVEAMIDLQLLTGMRPGEVCMMRGCDIDTTGKIWMYRPTQHKTLHHGHERTVYLGPRAKEIAKLFLKPNLQAHLFSPADADREHREAMHSERKTPLNQGNRPGSNNVRRPKRQPQDFYTEGSYRRAIARGCEQAFGMPNENREPRTKAGLAAEAKLSMEQRDKRRAKRAAARSAWHALHVWHPHQLRHNAGTRLRKEYGLEEAQVILGHTQITVTQLYAEKNVAKAMKIMAEVG